MAHNTGKNREAEPATMRGVTRALAVVRTLNENNRARVSELARLTRISRPSLYRILDALCSLGYLRSTDEERYELTLLVRTLSDGFSDEPWVRVIADKNCSAKSYGRPTWRRSTATPCIFARRPAGTVH